MINIVPPEWLSDQQLTSEYTDTREIANNLYLIDRSRVITQIAATPACYSCDAGNKLFFQNKLLWLQRRYALVLHEMKDRGLYLAPGKHADFEELFNLRPYLHTRCWHSWVPTKVSREDNIEALIKEFKGDSYKLRPAVIATNEHVDYGIQKGRVYKRSTANAIVAKHGETLHFLSGDTDES